VPVVSHLANLFGMVTRFLGKVVGNLKLMIMVVDHRVNCELMILLNNRMKLIVDVVRMVIVIG